MDAAFAAIARSDVNKLRHFAPGTAAVLAVLIVAVVATSLIVAPRISHGMIGELRAATLARNA